MKNTNLIITTSKNGTICKKDNNITVKKALENFDFINKLEGNVISILTEQGYLINFLETDLRLMGEDATGVRGIKLKKEDKVVAVVTTNFDINNAHTIQTRGGCGIKE